VRSRPAALAADLLAVVVFVLLGRRSHDEGSAVAGTVATAWPFVAGALVGEGVVLLTRSRPDSLAAGAVVTAGAVVIGMSLRRLTGGGTPVSFVIVATAFLTLFVLGWRLGARVLARRRVVA
jgi:peptidoglycan/LPS O-acetylase OafA/YrhL